MKRKKVAIAPARELQARRYLFGLLSELYPVDFEGWTPGFTGDAAMLWEGCPEEKEIPARNLNRLVMWLDRRKAGRSIGQTLCQIYPIAGFGRLLPQPDDGGRMHRAVFTAATARRG